MTVTTIATGSKPDAIKALRATWRSTAEHQAEQAARFVRLTLIAAIPGLVSLIFAKHFDAKTLLAFIGPFAEVAYRQVYPSLGAAKADSAPGVTIVPDQVGIAPDQAADDPVVFAPTDGVPVQTDNTERPEDGPQDVSQDPNVAYDQDEVASQ